MDSILSTSYKSTYLTRRFHPLFPSQQIPIHSSNEKTFSIRDSARKAREVHLILKDNTLEPYGLNIRELKLFIHFLLKKYVKISFKSDKARQ